MPWARITGFSTPRMDSTGRVDVAWKSALDFELDVDSDEPDQVRAEVWTNANENADPDAFRAVPMTRVSSTKFEAALPLSHVGNYRAAARVSVDGGQSWTWTTSDVRFRPQDEANDDVDMEEVAVGNVNYDLLAHRSGTFADMMDAGSPETNGKYTLEWLASRGKNALWIMPPFEVSKWDQRPPVDDAGSPYAVKDYFTIRSELSRDAGAVLARGGSDEDARQAALAEFKRFIARAHELGIKIHLDVALNHVGHNYEFRDLFVDGNKREVRKDDFSQVVVNPEQLDVIKQKLADKSVPDYMEDLAPWMYGNKDLDPHGAKSLDDKAPGGWWEWPDTAQLNHGRFRVGYRWWDDPNPSPEQKAVQGYLERVLRFWAVDVGVDGFRLDHLTGLPEEILEGALNRVQADVDAHRPGVNLFVFGEDFHTQDQTRHFLDAGQGGWFHNLLTAQTPQDFRNIIDSPWFHDLLALSSHDETRPIVALLDDAKAAARLESLLETFGGPVASVAGDDLGERMQLPFKQYRGVAALRAADATGRAIETTVTRAEKARSQLRALHEKGRGWLTSRDGNAENDLLAMSRFTGDEHGPLALVFCNLRNDGAREDVFKLDDTAKTRIDPNKSYNVRDLMADDPRSKLWPSAMSGADLLNSGVFARVPAYGLQILSVEEA
jgi:hypothetical protein